MVNHRTNRQQQAEETKSRLIDSALKIFSNKGYKASTTKDIAKEAGVTDGLIYHYFKSKEELIWAILERHTLIHHIQRMIAELRPDMGIEDTVGHYVRSLFRILEENNDLIVLIFGEAQRNTEIQTRLGMIVNHGARPLAGILARYVNQDPEDLHLAVRNLQFSVVQYYLIIYRSQRDIQDRDRYLQVTSRQFVQMLK